MALDFIWFGAELALIELIAALKFCVSSLFGYDGDVIYMELLLQEKRKMLQIKSSSITQLNWIRNLLISCTEYNTNWSKYI